MNIGKKEIIGRKMNMELLKNRMHVNHIFIGNMRDYNQIYVCYLIKLNQFFGMEFGRGKHSTEKKY